jgi:hypothetical protein
VSRIGFGHAGGLEICPHEAIIAMYVGPVKASLGSRLTAAFPGQARGYFGSEPD